MAGAWPHRYTVASYYCKATLPASFLYYIKLYWCCGLSVTCRRVPYCIFMGPKGIILGIMSLGDSHYHNELQFEETVREPSLRHQRKVWETEVR